MLEIRKILLVSESASVSAEETRPSIASKYLVEAIESNTNLCSAVPISDKPYRSSRPRVVVRPEQCLAIAADLASASVQDC